MRRLISFSQTLMFIFQDSGLVQVSSPEPVFLLRPVLSFYVIPRFCFRHNFSKTDPYHLTSSHTIRIRGNQWLGAPIFTKIFWYSASFKSFRHLLWFLLVYYTYYCTQLVIFVLFGDIYISKFYLGIFTSRLSFYFLFSELLFSYYPRSLVVRDLLSETKGSHFEPGC